MRIGIIAALPGELKPMVGRAAHMPVVPGSGISMWCWAVEGHDVVAVCAGMGAAAARRAFTAAEFSGSLDMALSIGWAGALTAPMTPGHAYGVSEIIDAQTGERFTANPEGERLVTSIQVASPVEKARLRSTYQASLVDMEASVVARLAQMRGIPMHCFKGVSDGVTANLPDLNPHIRIDGTLHMGRFLAHVAQRPHHWRPLVHLGRNSAAAAKSLSHLVNGFLTKAGS